MAPKKEVTRILFLLPRYFWKKYPIKLIPEIKITISHTLKGMKIPKGSIASLGNNGNIKADTIISCKAPDHSRKEKSFAKAWNWYLYAENIAKIMVIIIAKRIFSYPINTPTQNIIKPKISEVSPYLLRLKTPLKYAMAIKINNPQKNKTGRYLKSSKKVEIVPKSANNGKVLIPINPIIFSFWKNISLLNPTKTPKNIEIKIW